MNYLCISNTWPQEIRYEYLWIARLLNPICMRICTEILFLEPRVLLKNSYKVTRIDPTHLFLIFAFFDDTLLYGSGGLKSSFPMQGLRGYGFPTFLLFFRLVPGAYASFPFIVIQFVIVCPLFFFLLWFTKNAPRFSVALFSSTFFLMVFLFFARYFHGNFLGFCVFWLLYSWLLQEDEDRHQITTLKPDI